MDPVNLAAKLATFSAHWPPRTVAQHKHDDTAAARRVI